MKDVGSLRSRSAKKLVRFCSLRHLHKTGPDPVSATDSISDLRGIDQCIGNIPATSHTLVQSASPPIHLRATRVLFRRRPSFPFRGTPTDVLPGPSRLSDG